MSSSTFLLRYSALRFFLAALGFSFEAEAEELASSPTTELINVKRINYTAIQEEIWGVPDVLAFTSDNYLKPEIPWWRDGCSAFEDFIGCGREGFLCGVEARQFRKTLMLVLARESFMRSYCPIAVALAYVFTAEFDLVVTQHSLGLRLG